MHMSACSTRLRPRSRAPARALAACTHSHSVRPPQQQQDMRGLLARGELQVEQRHEWSRWTRWRGTEDAEHVRDADVREGVGRAQELGDAASRPRHQSGCARRAQAQGMVRRSAGSARWRMCRFVAPARGGRRAHSARARLRARGPSTSPSTAACRRRPAAPVRMSRLSRPQSQVARAAVRGSVESVSATLDVDQARV